MDSLKETLEELGYEIRNHGNYWQSSAVYRDGDNKTALVIYPRENKVVDFVVGETFSIDSLIKKTLGINDEKYKEWKENKQFDIPIIDSKVKLKLPKIMESLELDKLIPDYTYWINRGITEQTCKTFVGGKCLIGSQKDRQVLAVFNSKKELIGLVGRALNNEKLPKYKITGPKTEFVWPAYLNSKIIMEEKSVILVESPACVLKLWDCGVKNVLCLFGIEISFAIINYLIKVAPKKIYIATNNEPSGVGNEAAEKILRKLNRYFDNYVAEIKLPTLKDFCMMNSIQIQEYMKNLDK